MAYNFFYLILDVMYFYEESYDYSWGKVECAFRKKDSFSSR